MITRTDYWIFGKKFKIYYNEKVFPPNRKVSQLLFHFLRKQDYSSINSALDIGTGSGIQALVPLSKKIKTTVTDTNKVALRFAAKNFKINKVFKYAAILNGEIYASARKFDLIFSNPDFGKTLMKNDYFFNEERPKPIKSIIKNLNKSFMVNRIIKGAKKHLTKNGYLTLPLCSLSNQKYSEKLLKKDFIIDKLFTKDIPFDKHIIKGLPFLTLLKKANACFFFKKGEHYYYRITLIKARIR